LNVSNLVRVVAATFVLSTLSFAAGVAGDLSLTETPNHGTRVVLRIPPELPADTPRAAPLAPLLSTASAEASTPRRDRRAIRLAAVLRAHEDAIEYASFTAIEPIAPPRVKPTPIADPSVAPTLKGRQKVSLA
jgi:hypothetical protein